MNYNFINKRQRGASVIEFAIIGTIFFTVMFAVIEFGRLLWLHNALVDATRRAARYATLQQLRTSTGLNAAAITRVQNCAVYYNPAPATGTRPVIPGLTKDNVFVLPSARYGSNIGTVTVKIATAVDSNGNVTTPYRFNYVVRLIGNYVDLPDYDVTLPAESASYIPTGSSSPSEANLCAANGQN